MADILDLAKAGTVTQDALSQGAAGLQHGANLAMQYEQHQNAMQEFQNKQSQFKEQQAQWSNDQIGNILSIQNPAMRAFKFKQFQKTAQVAGVSVDPAIEPLLRDDDFIRKAQQAHARINNLPYDDRLSALQDMQGMFGDAAGMEKNILHGAGELQNQRYATNVQAQISGAQMSREAQVGAMKQASDDFNAVTTQNKEPYEIIHNANIIKDALADPKNYRSVSSSIAKNLLDKIINPGVGMREGAIKLLGGAYPGIQNQAGELLSKIKGEGPITQDIAKQVLELSGRVADAADNQVSQERIAYERSHPGVNADYVYSKRPDWKPLDMVASGYVKPGASNIAGAAPPDPVKTFTSYAPAQQAGLTALAARMGIQLDPKSPQFAAQWNTLQQKLQQRVSATAQSGGAK